MAAAAYCNMKPMLHSGIAPPNNLQPAATLPAQLKIRRIVFAAGWALHVGGVDRGVFVGVDDPLGAFKVVFAGDPDFRVSMRKGNFLATPCPCWLNIFARQRSEQEIYAR